MISSHAGATNHYKIGTQNFDYSPQYNFISRKDKGYAWAVLEAFARQENLHFEYVPLPLRRLQDELRRGSIDFIYPGNARWLEGENPHPSDKTFSRALTMATYGTMVQRRRNGVGAENFRSVAFPKGFSPTKWRALLKKKQLQLVETSTPELALKMVLRDRADGADIEYNVTQFILNKLGHPGKLVMDDTLPITVVGFRVSTIQHREMIERLNAFLIDNQSLIDSLKKKYGIESDNNQHW
ncbi:substrate-binding periplasmic protein [Pseudoteredinibacter isoporae]|uniref:substrate-binding periplasmic protein n=1 Tax=Pseudoteredinibacter isoporae TaxID=570281 RepID=UPI00333FD9B4